MENETQNHNQITGRLGEDMALSFLEKKGYLLVEKNYRAGRVEVDLIMRKDKLLIFVEVKTRYHAMVLPEFAVDRSKQMKLANAANSYLTRRNILDPIRFDIISIHFDKGETEIIHFEDAFYPVFFK